RRSSDLIFNEYGLVNQLLQNMGAYDLFRSWGILGIPFNEASGIAKYFWLGHDNILWFKNFHNPNFVRVTLIVINIWLGFPYFMALMTGIMTAIDKSLYEAADIDGASGFQKLTKITMPLVLYSTAPRSEEHTSELQSRENLVCRLLLEKKKEQLPVHGHHQRTRPL